MILKLKIYAAMFGLASSVGLTNLNALVNDKGNIELVMEEDKFAKDKSYEIGSLYVVDTWAINNTKVDGKRYHIVTMIGEEKLSSGCIFNDDGNFKCRFDTDFNEHRFCEVMTYESLTSSSKFIFSEHLSHDYMLDDYFSIDSEYGSYFQCLPHDVVVNDSSLAVDILMEAKDKFYMVVKPFSKMLEMKDIKRRYSKAELVNLEIMLNCKNHTLVRK